MWRYLLTRHYIIAIMVVSINYLFTLNYGNIYLTNTSVIMKMFGWMVSELHTQK